MKKRVQKQSGLLDLIKKRYQLLLLAIIFLLFLVLRFYATEVYNPFGWDQTDNAWAANHILVENKFPLAGMVAKGNTGFHIGPLYYYMISVVYWFTDLDPIASGIFAGITASIGFAVIFFITKKLFSTPVALIAVCINTIAFAGIMFDRVQWPVNFIPIVGLTAFYFLYKIITGNEKYILFLAAVSGFAFHIHFTAVFIPIIIFLTLPFFPRTKKTITHSLWGLLIVGAFFIPTIIDEIQSQSSNTSHLSSYLANSYHGFHLTRVMQLIGDAFIQFEHFLFFPLIKTLSYILLPLFIFIFCYKNRSKNNLLLCYLMVLFFIVPWFVFATYKGEISDYYFTINRFIALIVIAYLLYKVFIQKTIFPKIAIVGILFFYGYTNIVRYFSSENNGLIHHRENVDRAIKNHEVIKFADGVPEYYLYYLKEIRPK